MTPRKPKAAGRFLDSIEAWAAYTATGDELAGRLQSAQQMEAEYAAAYRSAVAEHEAAVSALARGETDAHPGERPQEDETHARVVGHARRRLQEHKDQRLKMLADLAGDVEAAAGAWWADQALIVAEHAAALRQDAEMLADALRQVREVRAACDSLYSRSRGVPPPAPLGPRTANAVTLDTLADLGDGDPFALAEPKRRQGQIVRDSEYLGLTRFDYPAPSGREPSFAAGPNTNPGRNRL